MSIKENIMATPEDVPHKRPEAFTQPSLAASVEDTLRAVLSRLDARKATVDQVRDHLAAAGILASREWVHGWLEAVNDRGCR